MLLNPVPSTEHVNATNTHALTCRFKGNPLPIITWERGDISLSGGGNIAISSTNLQTGEFDSEVVSTISITNILSNQGGIYTCSATNEVGTTQASTNLTVCRMYLCLFKSTKKLPSNFKNSSIQNIFYLKKRT